jgi:hypothetical protein
MYLDTASPANRGVLQYLSRSERGRNAPAIEPWTDGARSTWELGSHPDIVEHLWECLASGLPAECRALVHGTPALVSPDKGIVFVVALGTEYALRLPPAEFALARAAGAELVHEYGTVGVTLDLPARFGEHWIFGSFDSREPAWCLAALQFAELSLH